MSYQAYGLRVMTEGKNGIAATHGNEVCAPRAVHGALCLLLGCKTKTRYRSLAL
jgi:hypothetical protein